MILAQKSINRLKERQESGIDYGIYINPTWNKSGI